MDLHFTDEEIKLSNSKHHPPLCASDHFVIIVDNKANFAEIRQHLIENGRINSLKTRIFLLKRAD